MKPFDEPDAIKISRLAIINLLGGDLSVLSDEEKKDLEKIGDYKFDLLEKVSLTDFEWKQLEDWCCLCYRMGLNPLPALRKKFGINVEFVDSGRQEGSSIYFGGKKNFVFCNKYTNEYFETKVVLEIREDG